MEYNLERVVRFEPDPKHKGLYPWALQEIGDDQKARRDQIPWTLSHSFLAMELTLHESYAAQSEYETDQTWIRAKLTPSNGRYSAPTYSMFGTDRAIEMIQLFIRRIPEDSEQEENSVRASGWPSSTDSDPLFGGTQPDLLQFDMGLDAHAFDRIADRIAADQVDFASFRFNAHGFYSGWTPDIHANEFKVLCDERKGHKIDLPEGFGEELPRVGKVWDAAFSVQRNSQPRRVIELIRAEEGNDDEPSDPWGDPTPVAQIPEPGWVQPLFSELKTVRNLIAAIIAALLLGILLR